VQHVAPLAASCRCRLWWSARLFGRADGAGQDGSLQSLSVDFDERHLLVLPIQLVLIPHFRHAQPAADDMCAREVHAASISDTPVPRPPPNSRVCE
jgi:hypothetical protein